MKYLRSSEVRQHLFRGFHPDKNGKITITLNGKKIKGEWVIGFYVEATHHWHKYGKHKSWIITTAFQNGGLFNVMARYSVILETVGEYTGLTDKNGKKIFEGDILKRCYTLWHSETKKTREVQVGVVSYSSRKGCYMTKKFYLMDDGDKEDTLEIVGNIYDNPELLEGVDVQ